MKILEIKNISLKKVLELFNNSDDIIIYELFDTLHPLYAHIDKNYLKDVKIISDVINNDYDFNGLIFFNAVVDDINIIFEDNYFKLKGNIDKIIHNIKMINAYKDNITYNVYDEGK